MTTDPEIPNKEKPPPAKPGQLELLLIIVFLFFVAWGTYEFGVWIIKDGASQETEQHF